MGAGSQSPADVFRWFCIEKGSSANPLVILIHGFPSQAYSYRKVLTVLSEDYHAIAFDWLGFGFSDKPQPKFGFDYTLDGRHYKPQLYYASSLESLVNEMAPDKLSLVVQGYFAPVVVKYASCHQEKLRDLVLINPPLMEKHAKLPSTLALFSNFLLGEIFSQDPLRASDKALTSCGPYMMKEEDAMVYRRPYLTSGSSGFALNAISRAMKKDLKAYVGTMRTILTNKSWKTNTTICWGLRDRWLSYDGVEDFCKASNHKLVQLPMGHTPMHVGYLIRCVYKGYTRWNIFYDKLRVSYRSNFAAGIFRWAPPQPYYQSEDTSQSQNFCERSKNAYNPVRVSYGMNIQNYNAA
ncbi:cis-3-alkyl-4-alkyloxetan-2-one decarboxylase isoform X2 [Phoenix dactylifera]|uniref:Cis-3-alkyl-4-alkyloxetan-2-one decarboxylase isoform X2 n=1 Tax=Phoenix dactylifera TaxID=42345 RepID=A0A8B9AGM3_PHODC|nr:cis-3-alkyl-4-alkyloxetan-2-one decarboxylase isoform X2 [Phoenix dactylifera]